MAANPHTISLTPPLSWTGEHVNAPTTHERMLDQFLKNVERRALRMAELATGARDEAMDLVQEAMFGFVRHYAAKPEGEWTPLFYRVLDSRLNDWHRRLARSQLPAPPCLPHQLPDPCRALGGADEVRHHLPDVPL